MRYFLVTEDATKEDLAEAIGYLRDKQKACRVESMRREIAEEIDTLLDRLTK